MEIGNQRSGDVDYELKGMGEWGGVSADLIVTDPPFGIDFSGKSGNYARDDGNVVDGYVEWDEETYENKVNTLLKTVVKNTVDDGQALIFSGWQNSYKIHDAINTHPELELGGKLYWSYNFAPYCTRRPAHNIYEVFWVVKSDEWYYTNECTFDHCDEGEANLSCIDVNREYLKEQPKYPTRLPLKIVKVLLDHFSEPEDTVFDPLAGSGSVGIAADQMEREAILGDLNENAKEVFDETLSSLNTSVSAD